MIKDILDKYYNSGQLNLNDVSELLSEYYKLEHNEEAPYNIIQGALQFVQTPFFNLDKLLNYLIDKNNLTINKLHDQNGRLISQWLSEKNVL